MSKWIIILQVPLTFWVQQGLKAPHRCLPDSLGPGEGFLCQPGPSWTLKLLHSNKLEKSATGQTNKSCIKWGRSSGQVPQKGEVCWKVPLLIKHCGMAQWSSSRKGELWLVRTRQHHLLIRGRQQWEEPRFIYNLHFILLSYNYSVCGDPMSTMVYLLEL